jgi:hypothetical protein
MSTETAARNRALVLEYLRELEAGHYDVAFGTLADNAMVWISGRGAISRASFIDLVRSFRSHVVGPMTLRVIGTTAEGDRVAVEVEGAAELRGGSRYDNQYHFVFVVRDGKIVQIKEYMNAAVARAAWAAVGGGLVTS